MEDTITATTAVFGLDQAEFQPSVPQPALPRSSLIASVQHWMGSNTSATSMLAQHDFSPLLQNPQLASAVVAACLQASRWRAGVLACWRACALAMCYGAPTTGYN